MPQTFFKNRALSLLYPYDALTSRKKLEKNNGQSLRYLKTDGRTDGRTNGRTDQRTDGQGRLLRTLLGKPGNMTKRGSVSCQLDLVMFTC